MLKKMSLILLVWCILCGHIWNVPSKNFPLQQMKMSREIKGTFFLGGTPLVGSGMIGSGSFYNCYIKYKGKIYYAQVPAEKVRIIEDICNPQMAYVRIKIETKMESFRKTKDFSFYRDNGTTWEFHIPKNSIYSNIEANL